MPMGWSQIRGHDPIRDKFVSAFRSGRLGQAYLFVGPDGVGKRLFATEIGKALLCESPPGPLVACDRCASCAIVAAGTHPDFFTARRPEEKQEFPIEVMREFAARLGLKAARGKRKIAVLQDADDLNEESANCFLKTLEEPPAGSLLILLASSAESQLPTILSRCQVVTFRALSTDVLRAILAEHAIAQPDRVEHLVRLAQGSAGQALALNDDALWSFRGVLLDALAAAKPNPVGLAAEWSHFIEQAGKESAAQRRRASLVIRLLLELLSQSLRISLGAPTTAEMPEAAKLRGIAERFGPEPLTDMIEKCVESDYHIDRRVQLVLVTESLADRLTGAAAVTA
jgi:DNA polymerase-3 subunit delta'